jgi:hypothetical protein
MCQIKEKVVMSMSVKIIPTPYELGRMAYDDMKIDKPFYDFEFCDKYMYRGLSHLEKFNNVGEWLDGYKEASYAFYKKQNDKKKKKTTN